MVPDVVQTLIKCRPLFLFPVEHFFKVSPWIILATSEGNVFLWERCRRIMSSVIAHNLVGVVDVGEWLKTASVELSAENGSKGYKNRWLHVRMKEHTGCGKIQRYVLWWYNGGNIWSFHVWHSGHDFEAKGGTQWSGGVKTTNNAWKIWYSSSKHFNCDYCYYFAINSHYSNSPLLEMFLSDL